MSAPKTGVCNFVTAGLCNFGMSHPVESRGLP
jgi:hypothetical protein